MNATATELVGQTTCSAASPKKKEKWSVLDGKAVIHSMEIIKEAAINDYGNVNIHDDLPS